MTIRAKLYAAIVLTILGPLATTAVALHGMGQMGDRFDEVQERARHESIALELKFGVTDVNGWQTAYGYDKGRSRPVFERSVASFQSDLRAAARTLTDRRERELLAELAREFGEFMRLDREAYRALRAGDEQQVEDIFLGPEIARFSAMADTADRLAAYERQRAAATERGFDDARDDARKRLITVALGAGIVIVLLLITASDVARMALEGERHVRARSDD
jgi:hypothetical protein